MLPAGRSIASPMSMPVKPVFDGNFAHATNIKFEPKDFFSPDLAEAIRNIASVSRQQADILSICLLSMSSTLMEGSILYQDNEFEQHTSLYSILVSTSGEYHNYLFKLRWETF